jgi:putative ABC transport system permease protein
MLRYEDAVEESIQERIKEVALRVTGVPLSGLFFAESQLDAAFRQEQNESKLLLICGSLALVLASFGLYGLAAFAIQRQIKEVGIRKVMGASASAIVALYLWRFSRPIIVANLLAWPVAAYFVLQWIERFPYQMERAWLAPLCVVTLAGVLVIAMLTVSVITTRAATANPVRSLRYE